MRKYQTKGTNKLLTSFIIKSIITTIVCVLSFTFLSSEIVYKLDVDLNKASLIAMIIVGFSAMIIAYISVYSMKNSGALFGMLAQTPIVFYMLINALFNDSNWLYFLVKFFIVLLVGALGGIFACEKSKKIKVK